MYRPSDAIKQSVHAQRLKKETGALRTKREIKKGNPRNTEEIKSNLLLIMENSAPFHGKQ